MGEIRSSSNVSAPFPVQQRVWQCDIHQCRYSRLASKCRKLESVITASNLTLQSQLSCQLYYLTFWLESVLQYTPILSGVSQLAVSFGFLPASAVTGILITRLNRYRWAIWIGWGLTTLGTGLTILFSTPIATAGWVIIFIMTGVGQGLLLTSLIFSAQATTVPENHAHAAATFSFFRTFGQSVGVAIGGTVFQNQLSQFLQWRGLPTDISQDAEGYLQTLLASTDIEFESKVLQAYGQAFQALFIVLTAVCGLACVISLFIKGVDLDNLNSPGDDRDSRSKQHLESSA